MSIFKRIAGLTQRPDPNRPGCNNRPLKFGFDTHKLLLPVRYNYMPPHHFAQRTTPFRQRRCYHRRRLRPKLKMLYSRHMEWKSMSDQTFAADELSFDEFTRPTYDEWYAAALDSIGGADFEKLLTTRTYEGLTLQPLYRREDLAPIAHLLTLPGFTPFVRGVRASGH